MEMVVGVSSSSLLLLLLSEWEVWQCCWNRSLERLQEAKKEGFEMCNWIEEEEEEEEEKERE
jgi:hypothetical protein